MTNVLTVIAQLRAATGKGDALQALLSEQAAYRERREQEGLTDGAARVEIFRSFTE